MKHEAHVLQLKSELYQFISDASKDAYGFRSRFDWTQRTVAELEAEADDLVVACARAFDEQEEAYHACTVAFEAKLLDLAACGAGDRSTALRWLRDAQDEHWRDAGSMCYLFGLRHSYLAEV